MSSQFEGLGNGREAILDGRNCDLMSSTVAARPDPCSKAGDDDFGFELGDVGEPRVNFARGGILSPKVPILFSITGSLNNCSSGKSSPRRQDITRDVSRDGRVNSVQD